MAKKSGRKATTADMDAPQTSGINREEWLRALGDAITHEDPNALTIREIAELSGIARPTAHRKMAELVAAGRAARATKRIVLSSGGTRLTPAYKLIGK